MAFLEAERQTVYPRMGLEGNIHGAGLLEALTLALPLATQGNKGCAGKPHSLWTHEGLQTSRVTNLSLTHGVEAICKTLIS